MTQALQQELNRIITILDQQYKPEKVILYGSVASGYSRGDSDLDLVIIKKTSQRFYDRIGDVLRLVRPRESLDVLVYTPQEYSRMSRESWFIGEEVKKKGKVVYQV
ncbi:nucleotidyltransferase domain-containing protein [Candidatus Gottesmanbacteria bacterium]|nr:nucleotidyltransferase domain-containing protein [Candidatus Gottesmanbacteria bacterium]